MQNTKRNNFYFIIEEAYSPVEKVKILNEKKIGDGKYKLIFKTILQEAEVKNNNKRIYPKEVLQEIVNQLAPKAKQRSLFGELDHPWVDSDDENLIKKRASQVRLSEACVLFRNIEFDGKYVIAECETLTTSKGLDLFALIKDEANIGFSLRAFGPVKPDPITNTMIVQNPIKAITYDVVSNPSHSNARILEFLNEDINLFIPYSASQKDKLMVLIENNDLFDNKEALNNITFTSIPFGAIIKDLPDDQIPDEIKNNKNLETISIKIDTDENKIIICKNDSCIFKSLDSFIDDIVDYYFGTDNEDEIDNEIDNNIDDLIGPGMGRRRLGLPPIRYTDPTKCRYKPIILTPVDNIGLNESENFENEIIEDSNCDCKNFTCPILNDIEFLEFISNINEETLDSLLLTVFNKDTFELEEEFELTLTDDEIENILNEFGAINEIKKVLDKNDKNESIFEEINKDENYLNLPYKDYITFLTEEILNEIESENNIDKNELIKSLNESFEEIIQELNSIPDVLYELSLIDDKYENEVKIDTDNINEEKLDVLLSHEIELLESEIESMLEKSMKDFSDENSSKELKEMIIAHEIYKEVSNY